MPALKNNWRITSNRPLTWKRTCSIRAQKLSTRTTLARSGKGNLPACRRSAMNRPIRSPAATGHWANCKASLPD